MAPSALACERLKNERKQWRKNHPYGFHAKPVKVNGEMDLFRWQCGIPGKPNTIWEGGLFMCELSFPDSFPTSPVKVTFRPPLWHPNVYPSGTVCLSILDEDGGWQPSISVTDVLLGVQDLLDNPNPKSPAQTEPYQLYVNDRAAYELKVQSVVAANQP